MKVELNDRSLSATCYVLKFNVLEVLDFQVQRQEVILKLTDRQAKELLNNPDLYDQDGLVFSLSEVTLKVDKGKVEMHIPLREKEKTRIYFASLGHLPLPLLREATNEDPLFNLYLFPLSHVCGAMGFNPMLGDHCPACDNEKG